MTHPAPRVVAEAGQCKGSVSYVLEAMETAKLAGCWATKIQLLQPETIAVRDAAIYWDDDRPEITGQRASFATAGCLDYDAVPDLMVEADRIGIELFASPFDFDAIEVMAKAGMRYCKIASGDLTNEPFVRAAAQAFPDGIIMALGAANETEILRTVDWITEEMARPHALLACSLCYPTPFDRAELRRLNTLRRLADEEGWTFEIGYSDHTPGWESGGLAVAAGATVLEKHYTLDARDPSVPDNNFALDPVEIASYVKAANRAHAALGDGALEPTDIEAAARVGARRSICAARDIAAGEQITEADLTFLRPANAAGFEPFDADLVVGKTAGEDIAAGSVVLRSQVA